MAFLNINISGRRGLLERHQGDLDDSSAAVNLRYIGEEGQFADGIFNPFKKYGYLSPANAKFASLTGTVAAPINSIFYDPSSDTVFLAETGENILQLSGLDDTSLANWHSITSGDVIQDAILYEMNGAKAIIFSISDTSDGNTKVGFKSLDEDFGADLLNAKVVGEGVGDGEYNLVREADADGTGFSYRRFIQPFNSGDLDDLTVSGIKAAVGRKSGTGVGITIKYSIQASQDRNTSPFTYQGTWTTATAYALNDTLEGSDGKTYQCTQAHTSGASNEPITGGSYDDYWVLFGAPDGTDLVSGTFTLDEMPDLSVLPNNEPNKQVSLPFTAAYTLSSSTDYWILFEEVGTNMGASDIFAWLATTNDSAVYTVTDQVPKGEIADGATDYWHRIAANGGDFDNFDFTFYSSEVENWSNQVASGAFELEHETPNFLFLSENALVYWFVGNKVHSLDGGITGGAVGRVNENLLSFPSYTNIVDVEEIRSRMYIGIQSSDASSSSDQGYFNAEIIGAFVWDKRSQLFSSTDFYPAIGAKEIKKMFISSLGS